MITASGLTKRYGSTVAVDDLSFEVQDGVVTGFGIYGYYLAMHGLKEIMAAA